MRNRDLTIVLLVLLVMLVLSLFLYDWRARGECTENYTSPGQNPLTTDPLPNKLDYTLMGFVRDIQMLVEENRARARMDRTISRALIANMRVPFNRFVEGKDDSVRQVVSGESLTFLKQLPISLIIDSIESAPGPGLGSVGQVSNVKQGSRSSASSTFYHITGHLIAADRGSSTPLRMADNRVIAIDLYLAVLMNYILYASVNGYRNESPILGMARGREHAMYYPANMFNSNILDEDEFGGFALLTPDRAAIRRFCRERRDQLYEYSTCDFGDHTDNEIDEVNCVARGGTIRRSRIPSIGAIWDNNLEPVTRVSNDQVEMDTLYKGEYDICANLSEEELADEIEFDNYSDTEFNQVFNEQRAYNRVVSF